MNQMDSPNRENQELRLEALFRAYREACPVPEPSANFMPQLWQQIESRKRFSFFFGRLAASFVTVAAALCLAMSVYLSLPRRSPPDFYSQSYVEVLAAAQSSDIADFEPASYDIDLGRGR